MIWRTDGSIYREGVRESSIFCLLYSTWMLLLSWFTGHNESCVSSIVVGIAGLAYQLILYFDSLYRQVEP